MKKMIFGILLIIPLIIIFTSCEDDKNNYIKPDPCEGEVPFSADFHIYEYEDDYPENWNYYDTDTTGTTSVIFKALNENATYEWHIGSEIINERTFTRMYFPRRQFIPVTLIARRIKDTGCFPDEKEIDTVTRYFYTLGFTDDLCYENNVLEGTFVGYNTDNPDSLFDIEFDLCYKPEGSKNNSAKLTNLIKGLTLDSKYTWYRAATSYRQFYGKSSSWDEYSPEILLRIFGNSYDSIKIDYNMQIDTGWVNHDKRIDKTFIGWRLE